MFKQGRSFKHIAQNLKTKNEFQCELRAYRIYKNHKFYMMSDKYTTDAELVGLARAYCRANLKNALKGDGTSASDCLQGIVKDYSSERLIINSHWSPEEHLKWAEMIKMGYDAKTISQVLQTKTEDQCNIRAVFIHKQIYKKTLSDRFPVDDELREALVPHARIYDQKRRNHAAYLASMRGDAAKKSSSSSKPSESSSGKKSQ